MSQSHLLTLKGYAQAAKELGLPLPNIQQDLSSVTGEMQKMADIREWTKMVEGYDHNDAKFFSRRWVLYAPRFQLDRESIHSLIQKHGFATISLQEIEFIYGEHENLDRETYDFATISNMQVKDQSINDYIRRAHSIGETFYEIQDRMKACCNHELSLVRYYLAFDLGIPYNIGRPWIMDEEFIDYLEYASDCEFPFQAILFRLMVLGFHRRIDTNEEIDQCIASLKRSSLVPQAMDPREGPVVDFGPPGFENGIRFITL